MSSSDLTSSDKAAESKEIGGEEDLDSIDASLDAILSEAKDVAQPTVEGSTPAEEADTVIPPPADIQISLAEGAPGADVVADSDNNETPLPVVVEDEEPSYKAFADMVAPPDEPKAAPAGEEDPAVAVAAASEEAESGEILDADALIDSMTPAPVLVDGEPAASLAKTEESQAFAAPPTPPSDEEILDQVKLPPGSTPMPLVMTTASLGQAPGAALGDDDQTVISPMPPIPEPATLPPPRFTSAWATGASPASDLTPSILLAPEGLGTKIRKAAGSRVQTSVATLVVVVIASCGLGAAVMRLASPSGPATPLVVTAPAPAKAEPVHAPDIAPLPAAAATAPAEPAKPSKPAAVVAEHADKADKVEKAEKAEKTEKVAEKVEKPAPAKPAPTAAKAKPAAQGTHIALAAPKPTPAKRPAPAAKPKKAPASSAGWVDPFGQ